MAAGVGGATDRLDRPGLRECPETPGLMECPERLERRDLTVTLEPVVQQVWPGWMAGPPGDPGTVGVTGLEGSPGSAGVKGRQGFTGATGAVSSPEDTGLLFLLVAYEIKTRNAWQSLAYSPLGAAVSPPSK